MGIIAGLGRGMPGRATVAGGRRARRPLVTLGAGHAGGSTAGTRAPDGGPCPGWTRTGCCPGAEHPDGRGRRDVRPDAGRGCRTPGRLLAVGGGGLGGAGRLLRPRPRAPPRRPRRGPRTRGRAWPRTPREPRYRRGGLDRGRRRSLGVAARRCSGAAAGASVAAAAGASGLAGQAWRAPSWPPSSPPPARHLALQLLAVLLLELHHDGGLDGGRGSLDELSHLLQLFENVLALDAVFLGEFMDSGLGHASPSGPSPGPSLQGGVIGPLVGVHAHRELLIECS